VAGFGINDVELSGSATTLLVIYVPPKVDAISLMQNPYLFSTEPSYFVTASLL
jgi:hypothetical protein